MKKRVYLITIWFVTIFCIIGGTIYHTTAFGVRMLNLFGIEKFAKNQQSEKALEAFNSISFDISIAEIKIVAGDDYRLLYECSERLIPDYKVEDDVLEINQTAKGSRLFGGNNENCTIIITVPRDTILLDVTGNCNMGDLEVSKLNVDNLSVTCNLGQAILSDLSAKTIDCDCNLGNCEIDGCSFDSLTVNNDMGNVEVSTVHSLSDYTMDLSVAMGAIELNDEEYISSYKQKGDEERTIDISCSMGNIEMEKE